MLKIVTSKLLSGTIAVCILYACQPAVSDVYTEVIDETLVQNLRSKADSIAWILPEPSQQATYPLWIKGEKLYFSQTGETNDLWYDEQNRIMALISRRKGKLTDSMHFFSNGQRMFQLTIDTSTGLLQGPARYYHPDGRVRQDGRYENNIATGIWRSFDEKGKLTETREFKKDGSPLR